MRRRFFRCRGRDPGWRSRWRRPGSFVGHRTHEGAHAGLGLERRGLLGQQPALDDGPTGRSPGGQEHGGSLGAGRRRASSTLWWCATGLVPRPRPGARLVQPRDQRPSLEVMGTDADPRSPSVSTRWSRSELGERVQSVELPRRCPRSASRGDERRRESCPAGCDGSPRGTAECRPGRPASPGRVPRRPGLLLLEPQVGGVAVVAVGDQARVPASGRRWPRAAPGRGSPRCGAAGRPGRGSSSRGRRVRRSTISSRTARRRRGARAGSAPGSAPSASIRSASSPACVGMDRPRAATPPGRRVLRRAATRRGRRPGRGP